MIPENRLYVLGIRTCGLTSNKTPFSVLTYKARILPALFRGLSKIARIAWKTSAFRSVSDETSTNTIQLQLKYSQTVYRKSVNDTT